ncbi:MAG: hypothetical protein ACRD0Y_12680, partial [Terriglobales bacterium]
MPNDDLAILNAPEPAAEAPAAPAATPDPAPSSEPPAPESVASPEPEAAGEHAETAPTVELDYPDDEPEEEPAEPAAPAAPEEAQPAAAAARVGTAALSRLLQENPELAAAAANPRVKAQLYQMARRSQDLAAYQEALPSLSQA